MSDTKACPMCAYPARRYSTPSGHRDTCTVETVRLLVETRAKPRLRRASVPTSDAIRWSYGVTTVPSRVSLLSRTLAALRVGGFPSPRLFVDGTDDAGPYRSFGLPLTLRQPRVKVYANWFLALDELYHRTPNAERFAIFQDDITCYPHLRTYLERVPYPDKAYLNLYTYPKTLSQQMDTMTVGWHKAKLLGKGAQALVFTRDAVVLLLRHRRMLERPQQTNNPKHWGWRKVDGAVVMAMRQAGWREYIHFPSLVQHISEHSSIGNFIHRSDVYMPDLDALELLKMDPKIH